MLYLFVSQDDHRQLGLHPQEAVQLILSHREAAPVRGVHHIHQNMSSPQVVQPVAPQILTATDCKAENTQVASLCFTEMHYYNGCQRKKLLSPKSS